jgi:hypothetical protein
MNREIKFRAKRGHDATSWYYGSFIASSDPNEVTIVMTDKEDPLYYEEVSADPDSVQEFTGHKDINGTEIYEGDILRSKASAYSVFEVVWSAFNSGFRLHSRTYDYPFANYMIEDMQLEVCDNVYDKPYLHYDIPDPIPVYPHDKK